MIQISQISLLFIDGNWLDILSVAVRADRNVHLLDQHTADLLCQKAIVKFLLYYVIQNIEGIFYVDENGGTAQSEVKALPPDSTKKDSVK